MNKSKEKNKQSAPAEGAVELGRGIIKGNFLAALVTSKVYKQQIVKAKKGKGAYQRKTKHHNKRQESYLIAA
jgi:alternative ribosome-rescue factor